MTDPCPVPLVGLRLRDGKGNELSEAGVGRPDRKGLRKLIG